VGLAAVVGLVVEQVGEQQALALDVGFAGHGLEADGPSEVVVGKTVNVVDQHHVLGQARLAQRSEIVVEHLVEAADAAVVALEAPHLDAVTD